MQSYPISTASHRHYAVQASSESFTLDLSEDLHTVVISNCLENACFSSDKTYTVTFDQGRKPLFSCRCVEFYTGLAVLGPRGQNFGTSEPFLKKNVVKKGSDPSSGVRQ